MNKQDYQIKHTYINGKSIMYKLFYKPTRNSYIRITRDNKIEVVASKHISDVALNDFINKHIVKMYRIASNKEEKQLISTDFSYIHIFRKKYSIKPYPNLQRKRYELIGNNIYIKATTQKEILSIIKDIYIDMVVPYIKQRFIYGTKTIGYPGQLNFRGMVTKWGVCDYQKKRITIALQLGSYEKEIIDYVLVHEIAHLYRPDHSNTFGAFVQRFIPNGKYLRKRINLKDWF